MGVKASVNPIDRLLIELLVIEEGKISAAFKSSTDEIGWDDFTLRAIDHGLGPLIYEKLGGRADTDGIPETALAQLRESFYVSLADYMRYTAELEKLLNELRESNTEVVILKGGALANTVYPHPALRPFSDIDLLVKEQDWQNVRAAFMKLGYTCKKKDFEKLPTRLASNDMMDHWLAFQKDDLSFDIKLDLFELGIGAIMADDIWASAVCHRAGNTKILSLSPEYQLLHLCVHLNRHGFKRIMWFNDIFLLLQNEAIDWQRVVAIARKERLLPVIYHVLYYINKIFGETVPEDRLATLRPSFIKAKIWNLLWPEEDIVSFSGGHELALIFRKRAGTTEFITNLLLTGRVTEKLCYIARRLLPPARFLHEKYSTDDKHRSYLYYLVKRYALQVKRLP